ncbi:MAG: hypothetical protein PUG43_02920 [Clostridiales bacterium]|nr:hypothetical protein [Clostridiales bacterium]MDD7347463.1 hypothetical protein [Clostridiales bacterium]MDY4060673.1 hypothetical protein [Anaerovoracaceae bacterium]
MAVYGDNFRSYLNKFVFIRSTEGIEEIVENNPENINGYFAYIFWSKEGQVCLRIMDVGYGLEDYFETGDENVDFLVEERILPIEGKIDDILYVFDGTIVADSERYSRMVASTEMANLVSEEMINARENKEIDEFRDPLNQDIVTVVFFTKQLPIKSKAKVKCKGFSKGYFFGELMQIPFGWRNLSVGDEIEFKLDKMNGATVLLASV